MFKEIIESKFNFYINKLEGEADAKEPVVENTNSVEDTMVGESDKILETGEMVQEFVQKIKEQIQEIKEKGPEPEVVTESDEMVDSLIVEEEVEFDEEKIKNIVDKIIEETVSEIK